MTTATAQIMNQFQRRPTYNELVEMIEEEELKVKPSIENVIDRRATFFRNNQYGGRFDNPDLVGLQKQEQMRQLKMIKEATMREAMFNDPDRARFAPPATVAQPQGGGFQSPIPQPPLPEVSDDFQRFRMELLLGRVQDRLEQVRRGNRDMADEMLSVVSQEELPPNVQQFMMATPSQTFETPPLSPASETGGQLPPAQTMDEQLPNTVEQDENVRRNVAQNFLQDIYSRTQQEPEPQQEEQVSSQATQTITYSKNINKLNEEALKFQLFLRGFDVDDPESSLETRPRGSKERGGSGITSRQFYIQEAQRMIADGRWERRIEEQLLKKRIAEYNKKNKPSSSSLGSRAVDAGKFLAKEGSKAAASSLVENALPGSGGIVKGALDRLF